MVNLRALLLACLIVTSAPVSGEAQTALSNGALYQRCYSQLTGQSALAGPHWQQARSGSMNAVDACITYLNETSLNTGLLSPDTPTARAVFNQLYQLHRSWFKKANMLDADLNRDFHYGTLDVYDANEPALHVTRALFGGNHVREVVGRPISLEGLRTPIVDIPAGQRRISRIVDSRPSVDGNIFRRSVPPDLFVMVDFAAPLVQIGRLTGIRDWSLTTPLPSIVVNPGVNGMGQAGPADPPAGFDLHKNYGGGVLGSMPYIMLNLGHPYQYVANGVEKLPRRWSQSVFRDFMCREIPLLREEDVTSYLTQNSTAQFRKSTSCLRCHAGIDQMALTARNLKVVALADRVLSVAGEKIFATVASHAVNQGASQPIWPSMPVAGFQNQTPQGELYFRSYSGQLIQTQVNGIQELGNAIADTNDYYVCFAKRYFEYFTGINVQLMDPALRSPSSATADPRIEEYRNYVVDLGLQLRANGNLKEMITRILRSTYYKDVNFGKGVK